MKYSDLTKEEKQELFSLVKAYNPREKSGANLARHAGNWVKKGWYPINN